MDHAARQMELNLIRRDFQKKMSQYTKWLENYQARIELEYAEWQRENQTRETN